MEWERTSGKGEKKRAGGDREGCTHSEGERDEIWRYRQERDEDRKRVGKRNVIKVQREGRGDGGGAKKETLKTGGKMKQKRKEPERQN